MKYCNRPFDYLYLDHYNGAVCLCPWMEPSEGVVGNLLNQSYEEIWHSKPAERLRDTIRKGTFDYCRSVACPHIQNDDLEDREVSAKDYKPSEFPHTVNMAFDFVCNQSCPTCRCNVFVPESDYSSKIDIITEKILPVLEKAKMITASGHGDPFASPYMMNILENLRPENPELHILLETNGVFLDESHWKRIEHLSEFYFEIVETTNSYYEPIYKQISRGGNLKKLEKNQLFLKELRSEGKIRHTTNCMVVQEKNYVEIPDFIEKSINVYGFDEVVLKPIYNWGNLSEEEYWFKDVLNPLHPYNEEYLSIINMPIVKDNPKVYNFGGYAAHKAVSMADASGSDGFKNQKQLDFLKKWVSRDNLSSTIESNLREYEGSSIAIYGAAEIGQRLYKELNNGERKIVGYIDQYMDKNEANGVPVYRIGDSAIDGVELIIVTPIHLFESIQDNLLEYHKACCISAEELLK